jgi:hypothetical protein
MADGNGRILFSSGDYYEGKWKNNVKNGYGIYIW